MIDVVKRSTRFMTLRSTMARGAQLAVFVLITLMTSGNSQAEKLKLIELFTSHGCSSCPSADRLLGELLTEHEDLMALEFHVDYWNSLVHGNDGNFVDPFSNSDYSMRQREYNLAKLAGRPGVYTPQAVINGRVAAVGSNRRNILKALNRAPQQALDIQISPIDSANRFTVVVRTLASAAESLEGIDIRMVSYIDKATTLITGGENRDLLLDNHHVVTQLARLGAVSEAKEQTFVIAAPKPGEGCVVLVQEDALTPIYAAAECP